MIRKNILVQSGSRNKQSVDEKKQKLNISFTEEELAELDQWRDEANCATLSELLEAVVKGDPVVHYVKDPNLEALLALLNRCRLELKAYYKKLQEKVKLLEHTTSAAAILEIDEAINSYLRPILEKVETYKLYVNQIEEYVSIH